MQFNAWEAKWESKASRPLQYAWIPVGNDVKKRLCNDDVSIYSEASSTRESTFHIRYLEFHILIMFFHFLIELFFFFFYIPTKKEQSI